ncbi:hypothetical protein [Nocardia sp. CA-290969]|uniref:hypothetical protein n=1 Tax=Nocardia sp. CA-290969 TaxID=3239986 RepID=UPI003D94890C
MFKPHHIAIGCGLAWGGIVGLGLTGCHVGSHVPELEHVPTTRIPAPLAPPYTAPESTLPVNPPSWTYGPSRGEAAQVAR